MEASSVLQPSLESGQSHQGCLYRNMIASVIQLVRSLVEIMMKMGRWFTSKESRGNCHSLYQEFFTQMYPNHSSIIGDVFLWCFSLYIYVPDTSEGLDAWSGPLIVSFPSPSGILGWVQLMPSSIFLMPGQCKKWTHFYTSLKCT
jgi:hypothetical protein